MKYIITLSLLCLTHIISAQAGPHRFFDSLHIIASDFEPLLRLRQQFSFTEGPVADKAGNIYFTDQPNNKIWQYNTETTRLWEFKRDAGRANGLDIDAAGNIIACADEKNEIWSIDKRGHIVTVLLGKVGDKRLNGPNDLWIDGKGGIYFTDPYYQRDYWTRTAPEIKEQNVYYLPRQAAQPLSVSNELVKPNGIVGSADGRHLFVADIGDNKTYKFSINEDGSLSGKTVFVEQGSDGLTLDEKGNLYLTGNGITVFNPVGKKIAYIPVPEKWVANVCFGGKNRDILFITAGKSVFALKMSVKGVNK